MDYFHLYTFTLKENTLVLLYYFQGFGLGKSLKQ